MLLHYMQEIIRIVDKNRDSIPEQDYIDICNNLEEIYNNYDEDVFDDSDYFHDENPNIKLCVNIVTIVIAIQIIFLVIYSKLPSHMI